MHMQNAPHLGFEQRDAGLRLLRLLEKALDGHIRAVPRASVDLPEAAMADGISQDQIFRIDFKFVELMLPLLHG